MEIVEIQALKNGAHRNQTVFGEITTPDGWAVIPDDMICENFPFGEIITEEIDGVMTVTAWTPSIIPEPEFNVEEKIASLKAQLGATDYKVIKCSEAQLAGEELPYDIAALHAERQAIRD